MHKLQGPIAGLDHGDWKSLEPIKKGAARVSRRPKSREETPKEGGAATQGATAPQYNGASGSEMQVMLTYPPMRLCNAVLPEQQSGYT